MPNRKPGPIQGVTNALRRRFYPLCNRIRRFHLAWLYATCRLGADTAQAIIGDCEFAAGWHPLLTLSVEDTLEQAREIFLDHPDLPRLAAGACDQVAYKWESFDDTLYEAKRWAIDLMETYAREEHINLIKHETIQFMN